MMESVVVVVAVVQYGVVLLVSGELTGFKNVAHFVLLYNQNCLSVSVSALSGHPPRRPPLATLDAYHTFSFVFQLPSAPSHLCSP